MARLSKDDLKRHDSFEFKEEEVELPGILVDGEPGTILVRTPSVKQREELRENNVEDEKDWTMANTAKLFSIIVADPKVEPEEAEEIISEWPGETLDVVLAKFAELLGQKPEETRDAAGEFPAEEQ